MTNFFWVGLLPLVKKRKQRGMELMSDKLSTKAKSCEYNQKPHLGGTTPMNNEVINPFLREYNVAYCRQIGSLLYFEKALILNPRLIQTCPHLHKCSIRSSRKGSIYSVTNSTFYLQFWKGEKKVEIKN